MSTRPQEQLPLIASIADGLPVGIFVVSAPGGEFVYANRAFDEILGMQPCADAVAGGYSAAYRMETRDGAVYPEDRLPFARALREKAQVTVDDIVIHRPDGRKVSIHARAQPLRDAQGVITHVAVAFVDNTEEVQTRARAHVSEERLRHLLSHAPIILFAFDRKGIVTLSEGRGLEGLGLRPKQILGLSVFDLYANDPSSLSNAHRVLGGEEFTVVNQVGPTALETTFTPVRDAAGEIDGVIGVSVDVTERVKMQARLVQAERLASMGTLSATVAHEINNPLAYVTLHMDRIATRFAEMAAGGADARELGECIDQAREGLDRVRRIVRGLQAFSRQEEDSAESINVNAVMERALEMTDNAIRHRARVVRRMAIVPPVLATDLRLNQVFVNILMNAAQAIPEGHAETHEIRVETQHDRSEGFVVVTIKDTGPGMAPEIKSRIFEPFFTTKPIGFGTGLGLATCYGIVKGLGGRIDVESAPGEGATFRIRLPVSVSPLGASRNVPPAVTPSAPSASASIRGRILVVDDDPLVARSLAKLLAHDHDVELSHDPRGVALRILAGESFDVILCDLMMPEMTGMDLHAAIAEKCPEQAQRIVFITGGVFTPAARSFVGRTSNKVLEKPFDLNQLRAVLDEQLRRISR